MPPLALPPRTADPHFFGLKFEPFIANSDTSDRFDWDLIGTPRGFTIL